MAKKLKTAKTAKKSARSVASRAKASGFKSYGMHITEDEGRRTFQALKDERASTATFGLAASQPENLDPESAAKRILQHALESDAAPSIAAPKVDGTDSNFKSLGVETVPLTDTKIVKFRQQVKGIPVYGSLVSVELDNSNEVVSLNTNVAKPDVASYTAKISPQDALKRIASEAGYGRELPDVTPSLNLYNDDKGKWHLAYIAENVRSRKKGGAAKSGHAMPLVYDYVIDALTGRLVAELPRTPSMATANETGLDELGKSRTFTIDITGSKKTMSDTTLNIETFDFKFRDPQALGGSLPGTLVAGPFSKAAVSAHANAAAVATFLRTVLKRNNIDNMGGKLVSSINCVVADEEDPSGSKNWFNAFWSGDIKQMVYGQVTFDGALRSLASSLDVVGHELFHGVTDLTARLIYQGESGAMNESYSDIFGVLISNSSEPDIAKWNFLIGDGISSGQAALRDMADPTRFGQPKMMDDFVNTSRDHGGVHTNSGIHNFAAFKVMTSKNAQGNFMFKPEDLAAMFYVALTQRLSRQSTFSNSREAVVLTTRSLFRTLPQAEIDARAKAVEDGFAAAGIT